VPAVDGHSDSHVPPLTITNHKRQVGGTKAELIVRILEALKLSAPTTAPARLLQICTLERRGYWDGPAEGHNLLELVLRYPLGDPLGYEVTRLAYTNAAATRAKLAASGIGSEAELREKVEAAERAARESEEEASRRRVEELLRWQQERQSMPVSGGRACKCGNTSAAACVNGCCGVCCPQFGVPCPRHGVR